MKIMKKLLTVMLALMMVLSMALPAMADDGGNTIDPNPDANGNYTIIIEGSEDNTVDGSKDGHVYQAYQVLSGTMKIDPVTKEVNVGDIKWGANINGDAFLAELKTDSKFEVDGKNVFATITSANKFAEKISEQTFSDDMLKDVAALMLKHLKGDPVESTSVAGSDKTTAPYQVKVPAGFYLIKDKDGSLGNAVDKDYTDVILKVASNTTVYHKGSIPTVDKIVSEDGTKDKNSIEMAMQKDYFYKLVGTLPSDFDNYDSYYYSFVDTMSAGIDFLEVVEVYAVRDSDNSEVELHEHSATNNYGYHVVTEAVAGGGTKLTVYFDDLLHGGTNEHALRPADSIVVIYKAKLNENAVVAREGNPNEVYLVYSNNPNNPDAKGQTKDDGTTVYTYALKVNKVSGDDETVKLKDVEFVLYRSVAKNATTTGTDDATAKANDFDYEYAIVNSENEIIAWERNSVKADLTYTGVYNGTTPLPDGSGYYPAGTPFLKTAEDGTFVIYGLDTGINYYLQETKTNAGFNLIFDPINIRLTVSTDADGKTTITTPDNSHLSGRQTFVVTEGEKEVAIGVEITVPNYEGAVLPSTGGVGTTMFYVFGSVMVLGALLLLVTKKRMA